VSSHVRFVAGATIDLDDAAGWYEERQAVHRTEAETITISAIAHDRRSPRYSTDRAER